MIQIKTINQKINQPIFFKSSLGNLQLFVIHLKIKIPNQIQTKKKKNQIYITGPLGSLNLNIMPWIFIFLTKNNILLNFNNLFYIKKKKSFLNLYQSLIKLKIKGVLQGFKLNLYLKGLGFKSEIENKKLILKLGYSHLITVDIPNIIKVHNQTNKLIFYSIDYIFLTKFIFYIKNFKKPEPYKGKGLLLKNEIIILKEGKKSKK